MGFYYFFDFKIMLVISTNVLVGVAMVLTSAISPDTLGCQLSYLIL